MRRVGWVVLAGLLLLLLAALLVHFCSGGMVHCVESTAGRGTRLGASADYEALLQICFSGTPDVTAPGLSMTTLPL
jgi:hypothetical protein